MSEALPDDVDNVEVPALSLSKTPFFQAVHAERYQRQSLVKEIESETERRLICYVSGDQCMIDREDTVPFVDLLHNVPTGCDLDLMLHTGGGDMDAAEKLITMVRTKVALHRFPWVGLGVIRGSAPLAS